LPGSCWGGFCWGGFYFYGIFDLLIGNIGNDRFELVDLSAFAVRFELGDHQLLPEKPYFDPAAAFFAIKSKKASRQASDYFIGVHAGFKGLLKHCAPLFLSYFNILIISLFNLYDKQVNTGKKTNKKATICFTDCRFSAQYNS
jgi:hypothetical protein